MSKSDAGPPSAYATGVDDGLRPQGTPPVTPAVDADGNDESVAGGCNVTYRAPWANDGDNGGDALYAAAALRGDVAAILVGDRAHEGALAAARAAGVRIVEPDDVAAFRARWIIDGILGIGVRRPALRARATHTLALLMPRITAGIADVIAVDLPSGVDPDDGTLTGPVLPAVETVTFGAIKRGLTVDAGADLAGALTLVDIGLDLDPAEAAGTTTAAVRLIDARRRESG